MQIVLVSNFMNHHQLPFSEELLTMEDIEYWFVATEEIPEERKSMGYHEMNSRCNFVIRTYEDKEQKEKALKLCSEADIVIHGSASNEFIKERLKKKKLTFKYSERIYKNDPAKWTMPLRFLKYNWENSRHENLYLLCSSAYTSYDYSRTKTFLGKTYKWGYFPRLHKYENIEMLIENKIKNSILWAGRLIDWKHPEVVIEIAKRLVSDGFEFNINIIGTGIMENKLKDMVENNGMCNHIHFLGAVSPEEVRMHMVNSQIYLFTSDKKEGWGAVLNEAMNSGCSVVASSAIGAVPFLLQDGISGLIYDSNDIEMLYQKVKYLLENPMKQKEFGINAYETIKETWNANVAAKRLIELSKELMKKDKKNNLFEKGPCSKAEIIRG